MNDKKKKNDAAPDAWSLHPKLKGGIVVVILLVLVWVALSPGVDYAPTPRIVLFFLAAVLAAVLIGATAATKFEMKLKGFLFTTTGSAALMLGTLFLLNYLTRSEIQIAVFQIVEERDGSIVPVAVDFDGAVELTTTGTVTPDYFVRKNQIVIIFPEQEVTARLAVKKSVLDEGAYSGVVSYAGTRETRLFVGRDLTRSGG